MNGVRKDYERAVAAFESSFGKDVPNNTELFEEWKSKYGYIKLFSKGSISGLGLDKEYKEIINKYNRYIG